MINFIKFEWLLTLFFLIPGWVFLQTEGDLSVYFLYRVPIGQFLYLLSKLCGLYAFAFFGLQLLQGLFAACGHDFLKSESGLLAHRRLGIWVLILLLLHSGLFVTAASLRNGHFAYKFLLPNFFESYYPAMISLGLVAAFLLIITALAGALGKSKRGVWIWGHRLAWPAFFLAIFHAYSIGSETRIMPMPYLFALMLISIFFTMLYRVWHASVNLKASGQ